MESTSQVPAADHCVLAHRLFASFHDPVFRLAEADRTPVMVVLLGEKIAAIPLGSLQHECGIADDFG